MSDEKKTRKRSGTGAGSGKSEPTRDVGSALRTVYQKAIEEEIPAEMLELLGKLD